MEKVLLTRMDNEELNRHKQNEIPYVFKNWRVNPDIKVLVVNKETEPEMVVAEYYLTKVYRVVGETEHEYKLKRENEERRINKKALTDMGYDGEKYVLVIKDFKFYEEPKRRNDYVSYRKFIEHTSKYDREEVFNTLLPNDDGMIMSWRGPVFVKLYKKVPQKSFVLIK